MYVGSGNFTGMYTLAVALILILEADTSSSATLFLKNSKTTYGAILLIQICLKQEKRKG